MSLYARSKPWFRLDFGWLRWPMVVLVLGFIGLAMYVAASATMEEIRFLRATDQALRTLDLAKRLNLSAAAPPQDSLNLLFARLRAMPELQPVQDEDNPPGFLLNPWGQPLRPRFFTLGAAGNADGQPDQRQLFLDLEGSLPATACRHMLGFIGGDPVGIGLRRVLVAPEASTTAPTSRQVYDGFSATANRTIRPEDIQAGCGQRGFVVMRLIFAVKG